MLGTVRTHLGINRCDPRLSLLLLALQLLKDREAKEQPTIALMAEYAVWSPLLSGLKSFEGRQRYKAAATWDGTNTPTRPWLPMPPFQQLARISSAGSMTSTHSQCT